MARRRIAAFLYSRRNIVGSLLALGGLALYLVGLLRGIIWLPIIVGLYLIGYLLVPGEQDLSIQLGAAQDASEVRDGLQRLVRGVRGKVADDLYAKLAEHPGVDPARRSKRKALSVTVRIPNVYLIRQTALTYLPDAFSTYLRMPRTIAERRPIAGGRTPHDVLLEQLDLMDRRLADVADDIARNDTDKLLANGRFLAERFGVSSFQVSGTGAATDTTSTQSLGVPAETATHVGANETETPATQKVDERERVH